MPAIVYSVCQLNPLAGCRWLRPEKRTNGAGPSQKGKAVGLFKPTIVSYRLSDGSSRLADGSRVTKHTAGAVRHKEKAKCWYGQYRDGNGKVCRVPLCENKEAARQLLSKRVIDAKMKRAGLADPFESHRKKPLTEHLEDFRKALLARNNSEKHSRITVFRAQAVVEGCKARFFDGVQASRVASVRRKMASFSLCHQPYSW
jgi:hypothetical protein